MYEWETKISDIAIQRNILRLRAEIKRISENTLRGNFSSEADREYWVKRVSRLNGELAALEQM